MATAQPVPLASSAKFDLKHILVTTDFSDCSLSALKQGVAVARRHGSDLIILNVISPVPTPERSFEPATWEYKDLMEHAREQMQSPEIESLLAGCQHVCLVECGDLQTILKERIEEHNIQLVVTGTHGRSGLKKMFLGSVAEEVYRSANCAVLTVGPEERPVLLNHGRFESIVLATDFSAGSRAALPYAVELARESGAKLTLLHVVEEGSVTALYIHDRLMTEARVSLKKFAQTSSVGESAQLEVVSGFPVEAILRMAAKKEADLLVLGVHAASRLRARASAHLPWSIAHEVVCHAKCPVLTVRG